MPNSTIDWFRRMSHHELAATGNGDGDDAYEYLTPLSGMFELCPFRRS